MKSLRFPLKRDLALKQGDGSYVVYLKSDFEAGYYVDKFDPVGKEAIIGLALYRKGQSDQPPIRLGNPLRVTSQPVYGPVMNEADIKAAESEKAKLTQLKESIGASLSALVSKKMEMLSADPNADVSDLDAQMKNLEQELAGVISQLDQLVVPAPQYEWTLDFDALVAIAPNLELTPEFLQFASNMKTSFGVRIGDFINIQTKTT